MISRDAQAIIDQATAETSPRGIPALINRLENLEKRIQGMTAQLCTHADQLFGEDPPQARKDDGKLRGIEPGFLGTIRSQLESIEFALQNLQHDIDRFNQIL